MSLGFSIKLQLSLVVYFPFHLYQLHALSSLYCRPKRRARLVLNAPRPPPLSYIRHRPRFLRGHGRRAPRLGARCCAPPSSRRSPLAARLAACSAGAYLAAVSFLSIGASCPPVLPLHTSVTKVWAALVCAMNVTCCAASHGRSAACRMGCEGGSDSLPTAKHCFMCLQQLLTDDCLAWASDKLKNAAVVCMLTASENNLPQHSPSIAQ